MSEYVTMETINHTFNFIQGKVSIQPKIGVILGSGLGEIVNQIQSPIAIKYSEIPNWPKSTVLGHEGRLIFGGIEDQTVVVMQGRAHYYEGYSMAQVTLPVRVMQRMGIEILIVTNAAGAINPDYQPGDLMLIQDHLSLICMAGANPLRGPNLDQFGERFPDMSQVYDRGLISMATDIAMSMDIPLHKGVYVCLAGPSFETPADLRFLKAIGADAVGMSTVPEVIVARHGNTRVLGISAISNKANLDGSTITTHSEVLAAGKAIVPKLVKLLVGVMNKLSVEQSGA